MEVGKTVTRGLDYTVTRESDNVWRYNNGRVISKNSTVFYRTDFKYINEEKEMTTVNYIGGEYNIAEVTYDLSSSMPVLNTYYFKVDKDLILKENDLVVVESSKGLSIVRVVATYNNNIHNADKVKKATAWVVDKIDYSRQQSRKEATEKRAYILQQLEEKKEQMETIKMYALLAEMDPEAKKLVDELKTLGA